MCENVKLFEAILKISTSSFLDRGPRKVIEISKKKLEPMHTVYVGQETYLLSSSCVKIGAFPLPHNGEMKINIIVEPIRSSAAL